LKPFSDEDAAMLDSVLSIDPRVRYVGLISEDLKRVDYKMQKGTVSYSPKFIDEVVVPILAGILRRLTEYIGEFDYCAMSYEKVKVLLYRLSDGFIIISAEPSVNVSDLYAAVEKMGLR
jgi:hypothetical protein